MEPRNLPDEPDPRETEPREAGAPEPDGAHDERLHGERHPGEPIPRHVEDDASADDRTDVTPSSRGLGAVWGDAERSPNPGPVRPLSPDDQARMDAVADEYEIATTEEGEHYLTPREDTEAGSPASPRARDDYPDH